MATFYILPPREFVGRWFAAYIQSIFPGADTSRAHQCEMADLLLQTVAHRSDAFVIHREELSEDEDLAEVLTEAFGAEAGDEVVEVHAASVPGKWMTKRWSLQVQGTARC